MRHEKAGRLLELARMLASSAEGLTLDEMAERLGIGRRTAERMRDAVRDVFPQLEEVDDPPTRRFRIPAGLDGLFQAPTAEELAGRAPAAAGVAGPGAAAPAPARG
ncbi:MAG: DNA-binding transcriptional regulator, partial [Caulobacterales bacterium]